jgi:FkbM family methyltransferase
MFTKTIRIIIKITELLKWPFLFDDFKSGVRSLFYKFTKNGPECIKLKNGLNIFTAGNTGDLDIFREVFVQSYFDSKYINYQDIRTAMDIGANKGFVTLKMLKNNPKLKVVSIEPDKINFKYLTKNIESNGYKDRVFTVNKAIWKYDGHIYLHKTAGYHQGNTIYKEHLPNIKKSSEKVSCATIATVLNQLKIVDLDLIKIDVEGAEYEIIFNLKKELIKSIKYFHIECHSTKDYSPNDMYKFMKSNDFKLLFPYKGENQIICINKAGYEE